jgi:type I restriction enzyme M protein
LEQHDGKNDLKKEEKPLTPDDRKKLMANLEGYDIDPTMVRIAQVNMYLHQFKNPQIFQYDTLTSEERWNDKYDVILANPPFMSPRGGIRPHNKFGVTSNRAEVLFVDYIINHLKPKGRAGIIVPEGIIFQSGKAYKALRKALVENGLYAVVSLPGGVFQPYSGVKTSILLIDNELAKKKSEIAFVKISADGFDLGATKRVVSGNDIPVALEIIRNFANGEVVESPLLTLVKKEVIAAKADFNLSGDRYAVGVDYSQNQWQMMSLEAVTLNISNGFTYKNDASSGGLPISRIQTISHGVINFELVGYADIESIDEKYLLQSGDLLFSHINSVDHLGKVAIYTKAMKPLIHGMNLLRIVANRELIEPNYLFYVLRSSIFREIVRSYAKQAVNQASISISDLKTLELPVPPLEFQKQIFSELDGYSAIMSGARQIVDYWKPRIDIDPDWELVELGRFCRIQNGYAFSSSEMGDYKEGHLPVIKIGNVGADGVVDTKCKFHAYSKMLDNFILAEGDIVIAMTGATVGKVATMPDGKYLLNQRVGKVEMLNNEVSLDYVRLALQSTKFYAYCQATATGGAQGNISAEEILQFKIPLAPLETQLALSLAAEEERKQVSSLRTLISTYEERTHIAISRLWDISGGVN